MEQSHVRVETIPLILGVLVAIVGLAILADAWLPETMAFGSERRRRLRTERSLAGEALIGLAALCEAAALIGRDTWPYETVAMMVAGGLFLVGIVLNRRYLRDRITNRGALRRDDAPKPFVGKNKIR
jgi:drug/metabolite transporter (DMT)-like permease